ATSDAAQARWVPSLVTQQRRIRDKVNSFLNPTGIRGSRNGFPKRPRRYQSEVNMKRQGFATGIVGLFVAVAAVAIGARAGTPLPSEGHTGTQSGGSVHDSTWAITTTQQGNQNTLTNGSGGGASQIAVVTENDSQTAFYTVPGDATSIVVTMYNDAPPFWEGEIQSGSGNAWYGVYTHQLTVEDAGGNALQTITIDNTGGWLGAHNGNQGCNN